MIIQDIMSKDVITVSPEKDTHKLAALFIENNISGAPVVDKNGKLLGVVKEEGLIFQDKKVHLPTFINLCVGFITLGAGKYDEEIKKITASKASAIMDKDITTISADATVEDGATLMIEKDTYYLPVLNKDKLVGVVTKKDIVRAIAKGKY